MPCSTQKSRNKSMPTVPMRPIRRSIDQRGQFLPLSPSWPAQSKGPERRRSLPRTLIQVNRVVGQGEKWSNWSPLSSQPARIIRAGWHLLSAIQSLDLWGQISSQS